MGYKLTWMYIGQDKIRPSWWQPWANTVLYLPLDWDVVDYSTAGRTFTVYWATASAWTPVFATLPNGKKVADITAMDHNVSDRFAFTTDLTWIPTSWNMTVSLWMNQTWFTYIMGNPYYQDMISYRNEDGYTWMCSTNENNDAIMFHGSAQEVSTYIPSLSTWYNVVYTVDSWTCYIYVNWTQVYSDSYTYGSWATALCIWGWHDILQSSWRSQVFYWKLSEIIVENVAWTAQEVVDYFDLTKWYYWIS